MPLTHHRPRQPESRRKTGSAITEFGPALFILLFCAFFPSVDLIGVGLSYLACTSLNDLQLREAVRIPKSQCIDPRGPVQLLIPTNWQPTVMGGLGRTIDPPVTEVSYAPGKVVYVTVSTTFTIHPLLTIPFFPKVPGLGAPFETTISRSRVLENPAFAIQ